MLGGILIAISLVEIIAEVPEFRILAPEFVCPKDEEAPVAKPDTTIITLQTTAGVKLDIQWTVRWSPLPAPTQRFTLMLWRTVRDLEKQMNGPQKEPYVYVIENDELLRGVDYIFNVSAVGSDGELSPPKSFNINNVKGDTKLENIDGRGDMLSIILVGGQETYSDIEFVLEAQVTTCHPTQDYYFVWTVQSVDTTDKVDIGTASSRLEIPANSLKAGMTYYASCQVVKHSSGYFITQNGLPFTVLQRSFEVYLDVDTLIVTAHMPFTLHSLVLNHDYFGDTLEYEWHCMFEGEPCDFFKSINNDTFNFKNGLPKVGRFEVALTVWVHGHSAATSAVIISVSHISPVIQVTPMPRILNEGSVISLVANASNVTPSCTLTWYFASMEYLEAASSVEDDNCDDCRHGVPLTETLTIYSLEENFLNELTDYTNETEWREVTASMQADSGRARFVAQCGCTLMYECSSNGSVYADIMFKLNRSPKVNTVMITPDTGSALETIFRISTLAVENLNTPLRYSFYCRVGVNNTLVLGSYTEHLAVETFLPYMEDGTEVWVEVCDVLNACGTSAIRTVQLAPGEGLTTKQLIEDMQAYVRRCELMQLRRVAVAAIVTYTNAGQTEHLSDFTSSLRDALPSLNDHCFKNKPDQYLDLLLQLEKTGLDNSYLIENDTSNLA